MGRRGGRFAVALAFFVLAASVSGSMAAAHSPQAPKTVLHTGSDAQDGRLVSATWSGFDGQFCVTQISDGNPLFPSGTANITPGAKVKIQLRKRQRPDQLTFRSWTRLQNSRPVGGGDLVDYQLTKAMRKGRQIWIASFMPPRFQGHLYLRLRGTWIDTSPCGGIQMATWQFHLRKAG
jgi:hypothetical protein